MKILSISTMYPNAAQPVHATFVRERVRALAKKAEVKVIAPVPYFPGLGTTAKGRLRLSIPHHELQDGIDVYMPRFFSVPRIFKPFDGISIYYTLKSFLQTRLNNYDFDVIDANLAYPEGYGAVLLGKALGKPVTVTLRGHDINVFNDYPVRRRQIMWTLDHADRVIAVAEALKDGAVRLGADPQKISVVQNGVDLSKFKPLTAAEARIELNLPPDTKIILSVGHILERKGFHHIIKAIDLMRNKGLSNVLLVIVGGPGEEGDYSAKLNELISDNRLEKIVLMPGPRPHEELAKWYSAADIFCLASDKEGRPNVVLEAMACGLPVVATNAWGTPELIPSDEYGLLVDRPDSALLADALAAALNRQWNRQKIVSFAQSWTWERNSTLMMEEFIKAGA